mmetsp:Transcript_38875/g.62982  ORF Transcript_38875/g.62982 Transcript_38875/m.62982 type:complete len:107 (-) Transcript_38875:75-395(-)
MKTTFAVAMLFLCALAVVESKAGRSLSKNRAPQHSDRQLKTRRSDCERHTCSYIPVGLQENCILRCISEPCYLEIFEENPLEEGEIDTVRSRQFNNCARKEIGKAD